MSAILIICQNFNIMNSGVIMKTKIFLIFFILVVLVTAGNIVRKEHPEDIQREKILNTAKKIIESSKYCVLITTGLDGFPSARIMDPFPPESRWTIWMGTNSNSRKIKEIRRSNRSKNVSVYYESPGGDGYLVLKGWAVIVDDPDKKKKYFKKGWEQF